MEGPGRKQDQIELDRKKRSQAYLMRKGRRVQSGQPETFRIKALRKEDGCPSNASRPVSSASQCRSSDALRHEARARGLQEREVRTVEHRLGLYVYIYIYIERERVL